MILNFLGNCPQQKFIRLGVVGNNRTDNLILILDIKQSGDLDLSNYKPYLKITNKDLTFADKTTDFEFSKDVDNGKIKISYKAPDNVTSQKSVDMQLSFENITDDDDVGTLVWQSKIFNVSFDCTLDVSKIITGQYPDVLVDLSERMYHIEQTTASIEQYINKSYFPNMGKESTIYVDAENNTLYRFDTNAKTYYIVGSNYEDIKIINCNGGKQKNGK